MSRRKSAARALDAATESFFRGQELIARNRLFGPLLWHARVRRHEGNRCPPTGWEVVTDEGEIHVHPTRRGSPEEWAYVLAHCLLHLGFGHFATDRHREPREWNAACDVVIARFLADLKLGRPPDGIQPSPDLGRQDEEGYYRQFCAQGIPAEAAGLGLAGSRQGDLVFTPARPRPATGRGPTRETWPERLGQALGQAVEGAVRVAAGYEEFSGASAAARTAARRARDWFVSSYPLLGALAASFDLIENPLVCQRLGISIAAVAEDAREIYLNLAAGLTEEECRFVVAHELLHVGLRHADRRRGRDPFLWNVACDYVINGWLVQMEIGHVPDVGVLHDPALAGESAESIYDRLATDLRRHRKLATLRGTGLGDILEPAAGGRAAGDPLDLDEFYRRALCQGLEYHQQQGRGYLPAALIEEIRALSQPPIPWDVELAQWFDERFPPIERRRSYARASRRQSATPDIPRPGWLPAEIAEGRTFGVVLDTSGSMDRILLAKALGAIASYSLARDVPAVRLVFCDAQAYDQGYVAPEAIGDRVQVKGRGGTVLQPGIDFLEEADDFPDEGPILIITDGYCDHLHLPARRDHAYIIPEGHHLPFPPRGKVFRIR